MPKLNVKGSVLVGVLALSILVSVMSLGYLQVSATTSHHEIESLRDTRAFQAAESGLMLAARWLEQKGMPASDMDDLYTLHFDEITVTVDLIAVAADQVDIQATASTGKLPYDKRLSWMIMPKRDGFYGTFLNGVLGNNHRAQGGFFHTTFDGPTHTNESIYISSAGGNEITRFLDWTTVHHTEAEHWDYGDGTHDNNNYDFGVEVASGKGGAFLDEKVFLSAFRHHQDKITLPAVTGGVVLPQSDIVAQPDSANAKRALLVLQGNSATYYYWQGGALQPPYVINDITNTILRANNPLSVTGTVQGKTTVVTNPGHSLYPVGDIVYSDFAQDAEANYDDFNHQANYGVNINSGNALALVSGKDVYFGNQWYDPVTSSTRYVQGAGEKLYITASIIAIEQGGTHRFIHQVQGQKQLVKENAYDRYNGVRVIGSRTLDQWFQVTTGQGGEFLNLFYDRRLENGCQAPGIPEYRRVLDDGSLGGPLLGAGRWLEENIAN